MIYEFAATQDLHGYSKPWAPGTGKNLFDYGDISNSVKITSIDVINSRRFTVVASGAGAYILHLLDVEAGEPYAIKYARSGLISGNANQMGVVFVYDGTTVEETKLLNGVNVDVSAKSFTPTGTQVLVRCSVTGGLASGSGWVEEPQIEKGSSATAYEPYANICMPEGFNIWDPEQQDYIQVYSGYVNSNTRELLLRPVYQEYAGEELVGPWMSSLDPYEEDTTPTEGAFVIDFGGELTSYEITPFMLQTLLESLGIRQHFTNGAGLLNSLMDQAQGRVRSEEELLHLSRPLKVIAIGDQLPAGLTFKPISKDVLPGLPGKFIR